MAKLCFSIAILLNMFKEIVLHRACFSNVRYMITVIIHIIQHILKEKNQSCFFKF